MRDRNAGNRAFSFVVAINDERVFRGNVLASPGLRPGHGHEILARRGYASAGVAYNNAIASASHDIIVFIHQDMYLPDGWDKVLEHTIALIEKSDRNWGVLGCFGISLEGATAGHVYSNGLSSELGVPQAPVRAQSLDEIVIVLRKSSGLRFDPMLPHFHLFGTDICLESQRRGHTNYIISDFCIHNSLPVSKLPAEFWQCAEYLRTKWRRALPIRSCCITLSASTMIMHLQRIRFWFSSYRKSFRREVHTRLPDPSLLMTAKGHHGEGNNCENESGKASPVPDRTT